MSLQSHQNRVFLWPLSESNGCIPRNFGYDSVVCECNSTYCDSVGPANLPPVGQFSSYLSSRDGRRLEAAWGHVQANSSATGEWLSVVDATTKGSIKYFLDFFSPFSRPPINYRTQSEVPEDQGIRRSYDGLSCHEHPVSFCCCTRPVASAILCSRRYTLSTALARI